eukprot:g4265.t1
MIEIPRFISVLTASLQEAAAGLNRNEWEKISNDNRRRAIRAVEREWENVHNLLHKIPLEDGSDSETDEEIIKPPPKKKRKNVVKKKSISNKLHPFPKSLYTSLDQSIQVNQSNPKRDGTNSNKRYEVYKAAKTVKEFFNLEGSKGDLRHDYRKGYITLIEPISQKLADEIKELAVVSVASKAKEESEAPKVTSTALTEKEKSEAPKVTSTALTEEEEAPKVTSTTALTSEEQNLLPPEQ